jgi:hypothetical protein
VFYGPDTPWAGAPACSPAALNPRYQPALSIHPFCFLISAGSARRSMDVRTLPPLTLDVDDVLRWELGLGLFEV